MDRITAISLVTAKSGRAKVTKLEIPTALSEFNTKNGTLRVRVIACWATEERENDPNDCSAMLRQTIGNNEFSQIANLDGFTVKNADGTPAADQSSQAKVDAFKLAVLGKYFTATKYSVTISNLAKDLGEGYATLERVHDPIKKRTYSALSDCTLDPASEDDKYTMYERLSNRLQRRLTDKKLMPGSLTDAAAPIQSAATPSVSAATGATLTL